MAFWFRQRDSKCRPSRSAVSPRLGPAKYSSLWRRPLASDSYGRVCWRRLHHAPHHFVRWKRKRAIPASDSSEPCVPTARSRSNESNISTRSWECVSTFKYDNYVRRATESVALWDFVRTQPDRDRTFLVCSVSKSMILIIFKVVIIINDFFFHLNHNQIKVIMIKSWLCWFRNHVTHVTRKNSARRPLGEA